MLTITKRLEFDAGHRIPQHKSQCRNLHGHRYALEITLEGDARFDDFANLLFDQAWLAEGGQLEEPAAYVQRVNRLLVG